LKAEIGEETFNLLLENNQADLAVYAMAQQELGKRISAMGDFQSKLKDFQSRCQA